MPNLPNLQKTDPRVIRTRSLIREALLTLIRKKDFGAVSVKDIAEQAAVNRATFYAHYVDKFALLDEVIAEAFDSCFVDRNLPGPDLNPTAVRELIRIVYEYQTAFFNQWQTKTDSVAGCVENVVKTKLEDIVASMLRGEHAGGFAADHAARPAAIQLRAAMIGGAIYSACLMYFRNGNEADFDEFVEDVLAFVLPYGT